VAQLQPLSTTEGGPLSLLPQKGQCCIWMLASATGTCQSFEDIRKKLGPHFLITTMTPRPGSVGWANFSMAGQQYFIWLAYYFLKLSAGDARA
jgi:hypothetical protein